jgi:hypothetical protein
MPKSSNEGASRSFLPTPGGRPATVTRKASPVNLPTRLHSGRAKPAMKGSSIQLLSSTGGHFRCWCGIILLPPQSKLASWERRLRSSSPRSLEFIASPQLFWWARRRTPRQVTSTFLRRAPRRVPRSRRNQRRSFDYNGSGVETIAHARENGRIVFTRLRRAVPRLSGEPPGLDDTDGH